MEYEPHPRNFLSQQLGRYVKLVAIGWVVFVEFLRR